MKSCVPSLLVAAQLLAVPALALADPGAASSESVAPPSAEPKVELNARAGLKFPGEISPHNWYHTDTGAAPLLGLDASWVVVRYFSLGSYFLFSPFSFDRTSGSETIGTGSGTYFGTGLALKARFAPSPKVLLRGGLTLGVNVVSYDGKSVERALDYEFEVKGTGLQVGAVVDGVYRITPNFGLVGQVGFFSQPAGSATVKGYPTTITGGEDREFGFIPIPMLSAGVELSF